MKRSIMFVLADDGSVEVGVSGTEKNSSVLVWRETVRPGRRFRRRLRRAFRHAFEARERMGYYAVDGMERVASVAREELLRVAPGFADPAGAK